MGQFRQGVRLVHELAQGAGPEELFDGGGDGTNVNQALGRDALHILDGHALPNHPLHTGETDAELVLQQFPHAAQAAVPQVVDVVPDGDAPGQTVHIVDRGQDVVHNDVLGHQAVLVEDNLVLQLLALVLGQQFL